MSVSQGAPHPARVAPEHRAFPYLTGLSAQRLLDLLALRTAPAVAASAIAYAHLDSEWQGLLVLLCMLGVANLLRRSHYPLHLVPFASAMLYLLAPPLGAGLAIAISAWDGYSVSQVTAADMVAPVLGAWFMTGVAALLTHRFRRDREVRVAVIGSHEFARGLRAELDAVGVRGYRVIGCIDLERPCEEEMVAGVQCLGAMAEMRDSIIGHGIELLVLGPLSPARTEASEVRFQAGGVSRLDVFERVADACLDLPVSMIEAGQLYEELFGHVPLGTTTSAWFQYLMHPRYRPNWPLSKRALDLVVGLVATVLALPVVAISALAIKLTDGGPVLHRQKRVGEAGHDLKLIKLRTMRPHSEGANWTGADDDRVMLVGRLLRRLHVDELPQLWLVLKGEMSLVGPRPEQPELVSELEARFSYYNRRHLVKPGITGWAQVRCGYSGTHIGSAWKLCHDLFYLKRRSLLFDLLIMLETLSTVVAPERINRPDTRFIVSSPASDELATALEATSLKPT